MDYRSVSTICPYCGCGCGLALQVLDGVITGVLPGKSNPVNEGKLCIKGWNAHEFIASSERITKPLVRKNGGLEEVGWDEALEHVSSGLTEAKKKYGPDSIAFMTSAKCTNEENYLLQKFARAAVGTNNVDHCARL
jgi:predicted molibdopterin-dependent oxidoreductase YjgC